jgi:hypothetical protein
MVMPLWLLSLAPGAAWEAEIGVKLG